MPRGFEESKLETFIDREVRKRPSAVVECPRCGKNVTLTQETEEWVQNRHGAWKHHSYGPGSGECCGLAFLDSEWDGLMTFDLKANADSSVSKHTQIRSENK